VSNRFGSVDDGAGQFGEPAVVGAGGGAEQGERLVHLDVVTFGDDAFSPFNDDTAVECGL
jgi:hypothetical protein